MSLALALLLKYWREGVVAIAVVALIAACHSRDTALRNQGIAEERARHADSLLTVNATELRRIDTLYKRDTLRITRTFARTDTLRDSLLVHLTDTLRVKEFVAAADSSAQVCRETVLTCNQFHALAVKRFALDSVALRSALAAQSKPHWYDGRITIGPTVNVTLSGKTSVGIGAQLSVIRFP